VMAIEKLLQLEVPLRAQYIRVMFDEITRILNHLLWLGAHALDVGAMTVFLYAFRDREDLMDCYEAVSGARMHAAYYRPGGVYRDLPDSMPQYQASKIHNEKSTRVLNENRSGSLLDFIEDFTNRFPTYVDEYETLLTDNRIWKQRLVGIGVVSPERAKALGFTGPMLRGSGVNYDIRKVDHYGIYDRFKFRVPLGDHGDIYDRYMVRMLEMRETISILNQALKDVPGGPVMDPKAKIRNFRPKAGEVYGRIEAPKGELGFYLISDGSPNPYRYRVRPPSLINLTVLEDMCLGSNVADVVLIFGSVDIVLGEVDR
jgi:NADH-quinone oxidoreductase subunit D